jgi:hypothetical protein
VRLKGGSVFPTIIIVVLALGAALIAYSRQTLEDRSAADITRLGHCLDALEARAGIEHGTIVIVPVATETPQAMLNMQSFAAGPVEPRGNLLPFRPHAAGRGPVGERTAPSREPGDEIVESGVVKSGRRRRGDDGRNVIRAKRGHVGHLENSRPQS